MQVVWHNDDVAARTGTELRTEDLDRLDELFDARNTFAFPRLSTGLFPAAVADEYTGYGNVWVRDNVHLAHSFLALGETDVAVEAMAGLLKYFETQGPRIERIVSGAADPAEPMNRPHVRFNGQLLHELPEKWSHAQNDALGYFLWLTCELVTVQKLHVHAEPLRLLTRFAAYFETIRFWEDKDSGHWEEQRKVAASSIGPATRGLESLRDLLAVPGELPGLTGEERQALIAETEALVAKGRSALEAILPWECRSDDPREQRRYDAALLFLIYPLRLLPVCGALTDQILNDVREHLQGEIGIRRYLGDSYWCADYKEKLAEEERTADFSDDMSSRDALLVPGEEAQWCIFDPILSVIYGLRFHDTADDADRRLQEVYLRRSLAQVTGAGADWPAYRCPESYYLSHGTYVPNDVTPLLWTQANLRLALHQQRMTLQLLTHDA